MTIEQLKALLNQTGYDVAYEHFEQPPNIPYIAFDEIGSEFTGADLKVLLQDVSYDINLYTVKGNTAQKKLERLLIDNNIAFEKNKTYIKAEEIYQTTYSISFFKPIEEEV